MTKYVNRVANDRERYRVYINRVEEYDCPVMLIVRDIGEETEAIHLRKIPETKFSVIHTNKQFGSLSMYGLNTQELLDNVEFRGLCRELLDSPADSDKNELIKIGKRQVEFYCKSVLTGQRGYLKENASDLLYVQVNIQEILQTHLNPFLSLANLSSSSNLEHVNRQIAALTEELNELKEFKIRQEFINKDVERNKKFLVDHWLIQVTKKLNFKIALSLVTAIATLLGIFLKIAEAPNFQNMKEVLEDVKDIAD